MAEYGTELVFQAMLLRDDKMKQQGLNILLEAQQKYPTYWRIPMGISFAYIYRGTPRDPVKSKAAAQRFLDLIPPESKNSLWVRKSVSYFQMDKKAGSS